jgi:hypothetical protein
MRVLEIQKLDAVIQDALHGANGEPILLLQDGEPAFVIRKIDDGLADELIAQNPKFLASIQLARQQKPRERSKRWPICMRNMLRVRTPVYRLLVLDC